tara:strand:+ start:751 stop:930 length:180 start_codon:yes stop_codon:yes gene_type:complete
LAINLPPFGSIRLTAILSNVRHSDYVIERDGMNHHKLCSDLLVHKIDNSCKKYFFFSQE